MGGCITQQAAKPRPPSILKQSKLSQYSRSLSPSQISPSTIPINSNVPMSQLQSQINNNSIPPHSTIQFHPQVSFAAPLPGSIPGQMPTIRSIQPINPQLIPNGIQNNNIMLERPISPVPLFNQQVLNTQPGLINNFIQIPNQNNNMLNVRPVTPNALNFVNQQQKQMINTLSQPPKLANQLVTFSNLPPANILHQQSMSDYKMPLSLNSISNNLPSIIKQTPLPMYQVSNEQIFNRDIPLLPQFSLPQTAQIQSLIPGVQQTIIRKQIQTITQPLKRSRVQINQIQNIRFSPPQSINQTVNQRNDIRPFTPTKQPSQIEQPPQIPLPAPPQQIIKPQINKALLNMDPVIFKNNKPSPSVYTFAYGLQMPILGDKVNKTPFF